MNIQKILIPVDYSQAATNAATYGCSLAQNLGAKLILYHAYQIPVPTADMPIMVVSPKELEQNNMTRLQVFKDNLQHQENKDVQIECKVTPGFATDEITDFAVEEGVDLIVMGVSGSDRISHFIMGSVTTSVIKHSSKPVLIVPEEAKFKSLSKIALACDSLGGMGDKSLSFLKTMVGKFNSALLVTHITSPTEKVIVGASSDYTRLDAQLSDLPHTLHFPINSNNTDGLLEFEKTNQVDLLVMLPKKHTLLERIFNVSNTRKMAFHSHIPILALHD
jgi:nucleotide-binding universal stress UspA family protein